MDRGRDQPADPDGLIGPVHRRQFVLGPHPVRPLPTWRQFCLDDTTWVSHCPELRVDVRADRDGVRWALLGLVTQGTPELPDPPSQIESTPTAEMGEAYGRWTGRWVLIGDREVHMDAAGLLGCYWTEDGWASSSPALLAEIVDPAVRGARDGRELRYNTGISWFPGPSTRFGGIKRLLASQVLALGSDGPTLRHRPILGTGAVDPGDSPLDAVEATLRTSLTRLPDEGTLWTELTAGYDSRLVLSLAVSSGTDPAVYTRRFRAMSVGDLLLPPQLCAAVGVEHRLVDHGIASPPRRAVVTAHTANHVSEGDNAPLVEGQFSFARGIVAIGNAFGVDGMRYGPTLALPETMGSPRDAVAAVCDVYGEPLGSPAARTLLEYFEWVDASPEPELDWRDRFFIEQRQGCWHGAAQQGRDLAHLERFPLANSSEVFRLLLAMKDHERPETAYHRPIIERNTPELTRFPFNPYDRHFGLLRAALIKTRDDPGYVPKRIANRARWARSEVASRLGRR